MKSRQRQISTEILEQAIEYFIEFSEGTDDFERRRDFNAWLRQSPEHVRAYLEITEVWADAPHLGKNRIMGSDELLELALDENNVVSLTPADRGAAPEAAPDLSGSRRAGARLWLGIAASVVVIAGGVGGWLYTQRGLYSTETGQQQSIALRDGTVIELNSQSKIRVRYGATERDVELISGQALFKVAHEATRPFVVATNGARVRAVGTEFDVYRKAGGTVVTVLEGRVAVTPSGSLPRERGAGGVAAAPSPGETQSSERGGLQPGADEILLAAGEQLVLAQTARAEPRRADVDAATAWTRRQIVFQGTELSEVIKEFNRYNVRQLVIADPSLNGTRISGVFSSTDPAGLVRFLEQLPDVRVEKRAEEIVISSASVPSSR